MAIEIIANDAARDCARVIATNGVDSAFASQSGIQNVTGGPRHLYYTGAGSNTLRVVYNNASGALAANRCVLVRADRHETHAVGVYRWATYTGSPTVLDSTSNFSETLVGPLETDWVVEFDATTGQAFGVEFDSGSGGSYSKVVQQIYFGTAFTFDKVEQVARTILPKFSRHSVKRQSYQVREEFNFVATNLTRSQVSSFQAIYRLKDEPLFLYDSQGIQIVDHLLHGFVTDYSVNTDYDNLHTVSLSFAVLEIY